MANTQLRAIMARKRKVKKKRYMNARKWLNSADSEHGTGWIQCYVVGETITGVDKSGTAYHYADFENVMMIGDCSRQISLDFYVCSAKDARDADRKLSILIDTLYDFRQALQEGWKDKEAADLVIKSERKAAKAAAKLTPKAKKK